MKKIIGINKWWSCALIALLLAGCDPKGPDEKEDEGKVKPDIFVGEYQLGGTIFGLDGELTLNNNVTEALSINESGGFSFPDLIRGGSDYDISIAALPPGQACTIKYGVGSIVNSDVKSIIVICEDKEIVETDLRFNGTVSGLVGTLILRTNDNKDLPIDGDGALTSFEFTFPEINSESFPIEIRSQPNRQICKFVNQTSVTFGNAEGVAIQCESTGPAPMFSIGGEVEGLNGELRLSNNITDTLIRNISGSFSFSNLLLDGSNYNISITSSPPSQICSIEDGIGEVETADVTSIVVRCVDQMLPSEIFDGTVFGLVDGVLALITNDNKLLHINGDGASTSFEFPFKPNREPFPIGIRTQPSGQVCNFIDQMSVAADNARGVEIRCVLKAPLFKISGEIEGLEGQSVALKLEILKAGNQTTVLDRETITLSDDGVFKFDEPVTEFDGYRVTVTIPPPNQTCEVSNGFSTSVTTNISDIKVVCSAIIDNRPMIEDLDYVDNGFKNCVDIYAASKGWVAVEEVVYIDCSDNGNGDSFNITNPLDYKKFSKLKGLDLGGNPLSDVIGDVADSEFISGLSTLERFNLHPNNIIAGFASIGIIISGLPEHNIDLFLNQLKIFERADVEIDGVKKQTKLTPTNWRISENNGDRDPSGDEFYIEDGKVFIGLGVPWSGDITLKIVNPSDITNCSFIKTGGATYEFGHIYSSTQDADTVDPENPNPIEDHARIQCFSDGVPNALKPISEVNYLECSTPLPNENDLCDSGIFKACVEENAASKGWTNIFDVTFLHCRNKGIDDPRDADQFPNLIGIDLGGGTPTNPGNPLRQMQSSFFSLPGMEFISVAPNSRTSPIAIDYIINGLKAENEAAFADAIRIVADNTFDLTNTLSVSVENADGNTHVIVNGGMWGYFIRAEVPATVGDQRCFFNTNGFTSVDLGRVLDDNPSDVKEIDVECVNDAFTALPNEPILDGSSVVSTINVTNTGAATVTDVTNDLALKIDVEIEHSFSGDLTIQLRSPSGTNIQLWNRTGGSQRNIIGTFSAATFSATLDSDESLSGLNGEPVDGIWTLTVTDNAAGDTGSLISWGIRL